MYSQRHVKLYKTVKFSDKFSTSLNSLESTDFIRIIDSINQSLLNYQEGGPQSIYPLKVKAKRVTIDYLAWLVN
jgi:hypothetical protein